MLIHVVKSGETMAGLANRYHVTVNALQQINQLPDPNKLLIGQAILIPVYSTYHTVKPGEALWQIAQQYHITVDALIQANQLANPNRISPGTRLYIPPILHVVRPGETLGQIAYLYGVTANAIMQANHLSNINLVHAGTQLLIPRTKPIIEVNGYTYQKDEEAAQTVKSLAPLLTYLSPFAYKVKEDGTLEPFSDQLMLAAAKENGVVPMMVITNFTSTQAGSNLMHVIFSSAEIQEKLLTNILQVMDEKGYKGLNIDFENVLPEDREAYNTFLQKSVDALHPKGYFVSTALAPKTGPTQGGLLYTAHDYEAHGRIADFVILMTYEWGYRAGPPQAISPVNQMRRVVEYALSVIPANKIYLGFQIYARDWQLPHAQGQQAETFSPQEAIRRATQYGATIRYNETAQSPYFRYTTEEGQEHEVWFEDARSAQAKFDLVKQYNLRGVSYWALGYDFPQNWVLLDDNFTIKKL
ncbi:LysM peptidoglycan-binding domain-containing protein [Lysinibacillus odysseyi]|uniref:Spore gernimation protein n=1 Tax=Lysinibacillus odysseyi 34hs-1 = NBRC 100172 TaxID=1220589 RepID=A0A0A3IPN1_9BACI|nr:LysM peptidoglycan-binding domain-containing protein [Lysinibacillus odysseyi]KGR85435.1 spore gernimation protein [Lysinibacillus odysseyi 34hs-1 = NBRC 100172]